MKILLATHNPGKVNSYLKKLKDYNVELITLNDLKIDYKFEENEETFEANAKGKALYYYHLTKLPTIADDSGFEIDYLNGEPGVKSRRWLGYEASDQELVEHLKKILPSIPKDKRSARFVAATCFIKSLDEIIEVKNTKEGSLTDDFRDDYVQGFPYRSCFFADKYNKHVMDLSEEQLLNYSHRLKNINEIIKYIK